MMLALVESKFHGWDWYQLFLNEKVKTGRGLLVVV